jgi:opacity protein-like surface antigen
MSCRPEKLAIGLLAIIFSGPAFAEGPETAPAADWHGFYFGAAIATPRDDNTWRVEDLDLELLPGSWTRGAQVFTLGHDWQRGRLTYGAFLSVGNGVFAASPSTSAFFSCVDCETVVSNLITLRGRAGLASGNTLFFASGGLARANLLATNVSGAVVVADDGLDGWTLGIGAEHRIGGNLTVAVSYDHVDLGTLDLSDYFASTGSDIDFGMVQVGMNLRW